MKNKEVEQKNTEDLSLALQQTKKNIKHQAGLAIVSILMTVILMSLTICAAADSENLTQTDTHSIGYEIESHNDENNILEENDNNINQ